MQSSVRHTMELQAYVCAEALRGCKLGRGVGDPSRAGKVTLAVAWDVGISLHRHVACCLIETEVKSLTQQVLTRV